MGLVSVQIPAGVYRHGTDYDSKDRWIDANLVRWENNALRPIGGWVQRTSVPTVEGENPVALTVPNGPDPSDPSYSDTGGVPRGVIAWDDNSNNPRLAVGTYNALFHFDAVGTRTDITPAGFIGGDVNSAENLGYGGYFFGVGVYGEERPSNNIFDEATSWSLDTWGEYLVGVSTSDQKIYEWQLNPAAKAVQIANSPNCRALVVTEDRFLMALGAGTGVLNPRLVKWCDREDNTDWVASAVNEAGEIELQTNGQILSGVNTRGRVLILTSVDAHAGTYSGPPAVYGFEKIGENCGTVSRNSCIAVDEGAFWMSYNGFFAYNGSAVSDLPCEVQDYVFDDINRLELSKITVVDNSQYNEIWWFYPSVNSLNNDRYVAYDYKENLWNIGRLDRSAAVDVGVFTVPIWFDALGNIWDHETAFDHQGEIPYAETGPISIGNGQNIMKVTELISDEETLGDVTTTWKTRFYPTGQEYQYGPFTMANPTGVRFTGRQVRMRVDGVNLVKWKVGTMRINVEQGGER